MKKWVQDTEFRVQDTEFRVQDSEFRVQDTEFRVQDTEFRELGIPLLVHPRRGTAALDGVAVTERGLDNRVLPRGLCRGPRWVQHGSGQRV